MWRTGLAGTLFKDLLGGGGGQIDQTAGDSKQMQTKWGLEWGEVGN